MRAIACLCALLAVAEASRWENPVDKINNWAKQIHMPAKGADGKFHMFGDQSLMQAGSKTKQPVTLEGGAHVVSGMPFKDWSFNDFHLSPKRGSDGHYYHLYRPTAEIQSTTELSQTGQNIVNAPQSNTVVMYKSDISNKPLNWGDFFHKRGQAYDITGQEWSMLAPQERDQYIRIDSEAQLQAFMPDYDAPAAAPQPQQQQQQPGNIVTSYKSDISNKLLMFGQFYHKVGAAFDINQEEYNGLPQAEKVRYTLISSPRDLEAYQRDYTAPAPAPQPAQQMPPQPQPAAQPQVPAGTKIVSHFRSDISDTPLVFGQFYHKLGEAYDINAQEFEALVPAEKSKYTLISTETELRQYQKDYDNGAQANNQPGHWVNRWRSDISKQLLEFGKFYHKMGEAYDISEREWNLLSDTEKAKYSRVDSAADLARFKSDWDHTGTPRKAQSPAAQPAAMAPPAPEQPKVAIPKVLVQSVHAAVQKPIMKPITLASPKIVGGESRINAKAGSNLIKAKQLNLQLQPATANEPAPSKLDI